MKRLSKVSRSDFARLNSYKAFVKLFRAQTRDPKTGAVLFIYVGSQHDLSMASNMIYFVGEIYQLP